MELEDALGRVDLELPIRDAMSPRPALRSLAPVLDGVALLIAVAISVAAPPFVVAAVVTFAALNLDTARAYRLDPRVSDEIGWLLVRVAVPVLAVAAFAEVGLVPGTDGAHLGRLVVAGAAAALLVTFGRAIAYAVRRAAKCRGLIAERALIVGTGPIGVELADALDRHPEYGLQPIGFVDGPIDVELPHPMLGGPHDLGRVVREFGVQRILVAFGRGNDRDTATVLRSLGSLPVEVHVVPRFFELGGVPAAEADSVRGIPLMHLKRPALRRVGRIGKRALDVVVSSTLLLLCAPVFAVAAIAVRFSSPGPVLFRQIRAGRGGHRFTILKFRTMYVEAEPAAEPRSSFVVEHHRVTPVGKILRRTSVDELPQLINVLRGEMSIVGPRPEVPHYVEEFSASVSTYGDRLRVEGGITGLAQVAGRSRGLDSIPERARLDNLYIETRSLWGDIVLIFRTVEVVFRGDKDCE
ncbi:MAG TPA: sugar transferase [Actinomycetota bacterium]|nr:sugar transferase [Actinomycetota bacterium]